MTGLLAMAQHLPRRTVRLRLTLLYVGLFLASAAGLLVITYFLVAQQLPRVEISSKVSSGADGNALFISRGPDGVAAAGGPGQSSTAAGGPGQSSTAAGGPGQSSTAGGNDLTDTARTAMDAVRRGVVAYSGVSD